MEFQTQERHKLQTSLFFLTSSQIHETVHPKITLSLRALVHLYKIAQILLMMVSTSYMKYYKINSKYTSELDESQNFERMKQKNLKPPYQFKTRITFT